MEQVTDLLSRGRGKARRSAETVSCCRELWGTEKKKDATARGVRVPFRCQYERSVTIATATAAAAAATVTAAAAATEAAATATAAAAATEAAAATTTAATTAAEATAAAAALGTLLSLVDAEGTTVEERAVHLGNRLLGLLSSRHGDEAEAAGLTRIAIGHDVDVDDLAARDGERVTERVLGGVERKIADVEARAHG